MGPAPSQPPRTHPACPSDPAIAGAAWPWPLNELQIGRWQHDALSPNYHLSPMPQWFQQFDWHWHGKQVHNSSSSHPRSVYIQPDEAHAAALKKRLDELNLPAGSIAALAVGGYDSALSDVLSEIPQVGELLRDKTFRHTYFEGLDRPYFRTRPLPEGLADNYVCDYTREIRDACAPPALTLSHCSAASPYLTRGSDRAY